MRIANVRDKRELGVWLGWVIVTYTNSGTLNRVTMTRRTHRQLSIGWWWGVTNIQFQ